MGPEAPRRKAGHPADVAIGRGAVGVRGCLSANFRRYGRKCEAAFCEVPLWE